MVGAAAIYNHDTLAAHCPDQFLTGEANLGNLGEFNAHGTVGAD
jgi:hypothetical protein